MRILVEVVADDRDDLATLLREVATKVKRSKEKSGETESYCLGEYRVIVDARGEYQIHREVDADLYEMAGSKPPHECGSHLLPLEAAAGQRFTCSECKTEFVVSLDYPHIGALWVPA
jgi:hypothetical protein